MISCKISRFVLGGGPITAQALTDDEEKRLAAGLGLDETYECEYDPENDKFSTGTRILNPTTKMILYGSGEQLEKSDEQSHEPLETYE